MLLGHPADGPPRHILPGYFRALAIEGQQNSQPKQPEEEVGD
jgi:hypothetical protein